MAALRQGLRPARWPGRQDPMWYRFMLILLLRPAEHMAGA
jgi:hypothetical protein